MGVGDTVELDSKGRITIPVEIRRTMNKKVFRVELAGKEAIILKAVENRREFVRKVADIKLVGKRERASADAAAVKDFYGGIKD